MDTVAASARESIAEAVEAWKSHLVRKGRVDRYISQAVGAVEKFARYTGISDPESVTSRAIDEYKYDGFVKSRGGSTRSSWYKGEKIPMYHPLMRSAETQVCVVGAGIAKRFADVGSMLASGAPLFTREATSTLNVPIADAMSWPTTL